MRVGLEKKAFNVNAIRALNRTLKSLFPVSLKCLRPRGTLKSHKQNRALGLKHRLKISG